MNSITQRSQEGFEGLVMLVREDFRRRHDTGLVIIIYRQ